MKHALLALSLALTACRGAPPTTPGGGSGGEEGGSSDDTGGGGGEEGTGDDTAEPLDADGDGWPASEDCDDTNPDIHPGATEHCDGVDEDCDEEIDEGFLAPWCVPDPAASCTLAAAPRVPVQPLLHLDFEDPASPQTSTGSLGPTELVFSSATTLATEGALGQGLLFEAGERRNLLFLANEALEVEEFTVSAWVKPASFGDRGTLINMIWDSAPAGFSVDISWGFLTMRLGDGDDIVTAGVPLPTETWSHVVAAWDGEVATLYVDGELRAREHVDASFGGVQHYPAHLVVGAYQNTTYYNLDGALDELSLYDRALSPVEVGELLVASRQRFEGADALVDHGPRGLDATAETELSQVCGPVGDAWLRTAEDPPVLVPEHPALGPVPGLGLRLLVRPDAEQDAVLAALEDAFELRWQGGALAWSVVCAGGSAVELSTPALQPGLWSSVELSAHGNHGRIVVDGVELLDQRLDCFDEDWTFELQPGQGPLAIGARADGSLGFAGALDEVELRALPRGGAAESRSLELASWRASAATAQTEALQSGAGPALDLAGSLSRVETSDARYPCFHLQASTAQDCPHQEGEATAEAALLGPLSLHAQARAVGGVVGDTPILGVEDGPGIWLTPSGWVARWGEVEAAGGPVPEDRWTPVALAIAHDELRLFVDGELVATAVLDLGAGPTQRFSLGGSALSWGDPTSATWLEEAGVDAFAWTADTALARHAPWRTETHPRLSSHEAMGTISGTDWEAQAATIVDEWKAGTLDPGDEDLTAYNRSYRAWYLAEGAWQAGETGEAFELALALLEDVDHGTWDWSWLQGRSLFWYALAYDRVAALLLELEADDPHTWSPRHATLRRRWASTLHHIGVTGGIHDDPVYVDHGYHHPQPGWLGANSRLMSVGGSGHVSLAMPALADPDFGTATEHLRLSIDDLFYRRPGGAEAQGRYLEAYLHDSGLFTEGHGYQNDVFYGLTPFLIDWWQLGGEDRVSTGAVRAMYEANVAAMLPTGHVWPYATGWLSQQVHNDLVAEFVPESADTFRWFADRQYGYATTLPEPEWTSAVIGDEAMILRSGWDEDDLWLGLKGRTAPCPSSHCQEDQLSLMLVAHGAWLLIDPGDGRSYRGTGQDWKEPWLQSAQGHNNLLIGGQGPGLTKDRDTLDDPATLVASLLSPHADYGRMEGTIGGGSAAGGGDHTRHIWLVDDAFFVVLDEGAAASSVAMDQQLHLGANTSGVYGTLSTSTPDLTWTTTNDLGDTVELDVVQLVAPGAITLSTSTTGGTNFRYPYTWDHTYVRARQQDSSAAWFTLLLSGTASDPVPVARVLQESETLRQAEVELDDGTVIEVAYNATGGVAALGSVDTDALLSGSDLDSWLFLAQGTEASATAELGAWSSCSLDALQLAFDGNALEGVLSRDAATSCTLEVAWSGGTPGTVEVDGASSSAWSLEDGAILLDPAPESSLFIEP